MFDTPTQSARHVFARLLTLIAASLTATVSAQDGRAVPRPAFADPAGMSSGSAPAPTFSNAPTWHVLPHSRTLTPAGPLEDIMLSDVARLNQRLAAGRPPEVTPSPWLSLVPRDCNYSVTPGRYERGARDAARNFLCTR